MKKTFLSLALALALALGLSLAVPAFAADPSVYESENVRITNVLQKESIEETVFNGIAIGSCTCVAPATITPNAKFGDDIIWHIAIFPEDLPEDGSVEDLDWDTFADYSGKDLTLTEPGEYTVGFESESTEAMCRFSITIQAAVDPNPTVPGTTDPTTTTPSAPNFTDVKSGDWFHDSVAWAVEKEITNGTSATTFSPNQDCTAAHILTFLWRANGSPEPTGDKPDVKGGADWAADAIVWAYSKGIDSFNPDMPCTRSMAVYYMWLAAGSPKAQAASFTDVSADAPYAQAVAWAVEQGVTEGTSPTTFSPDTVCTRGHIVTFLYRAFGE